MSATSNLHKFLLSVIFPLLLLFLFPIHFIIIECSLLPLPVEIVDKLLRGAPRDASMA